MNPPGHFGMIRPAMHPHHLFGPQPGHNVMLGMMHGGGMGNYGYNYPYNVNESDDEESEYNYDGGRLVNFYLGPT